MKRLEFRELIKECLCEILSEGTSFDHMVQPNEQGRHPQHQHLVYYEFEPHHGSYIVTAPKTQDGDMLMSSEDVEHTFGREAIDNEFIYGVDDYLEYLETENIQEDDRESYRKQMDNLTKNSPKTDIKVYDTIGNGNYIGHATHIFDLKNLALHAMKNGSGASLHGTIGDQEISGAVTKHDLKMLLSQFGYPGDEVHSLREDLDKNQLSRSVGKYLTKKLQGQPWPSFEEFQAVLNNRRVLTMLSKYPIDVAGAKAGEIILAVHDHPLNESNKKTSKRN